MVADAEERKAELAHLNKHTEDGPTMFKIPDDPRITPFGRFLRRCRSTSCRSCWNVLRGEMSLVGPRPLILAEDENVVGAGPAAPAPDAGHDRPLAGARAGATSRSRR